MSKLTQALITTDAEVSKDIQAIAGVDYPIYIWAGFRGQGDYWHDWVQDKTGFFVLDVHPCERAILRSILLNMS